MPAHSAFQLIGSRSHQCDATATYTRDGVHAYALLDGIGSTDEIRDWTRTAARRLARAAARRLARAAAVHGDAETGLHRVYEEAATETGRSPFDELPSACAVVAVTAPNGRLTVAWCGDSRAYLLADGKLERLTVDHNMRQVLLDRGQTPGIYARNRVTSWLGNTDTEPEPGEQPLIGTVTRTTAGRLLLASDGAYEPLEDSCVNLADFLDGTPAQAARSVVRGAIERASGRADNATALVADLPALEPDMSEPVVFHRVIVRAPSEDMFPGWHTDVPPADAFDPAAVRITHVGEVRPGDTVIGTVQHRHGPDLEPLDQAQWVSYFSHACQPQTEGARPFDPAHCDHCVHEAYVRDIGAASGYWTVDGCTTYRPDSLLLVVPRELNSPSHPLVKQTPIGSPS